MRFYGNDKRFLNLGENLSWIYKLSLLIITILKVDVKVNCPHSCIKIRELFSSGPMVKFYSHISMHGPMGPCNHIGPLTQSKNIAKFFSQLSILSFILTCRFCWTPALGLNLSHKDLAMGIMDEIPTHWSGGHIYGYKQGWWTFKKRVWRIQSPGLAVLLVDLKALLRSLQNTVRFCFWWIDVFCRLSS